MKIYSRDFKTSTNPVMDTLTNFVSCCQWMSIQVHVQLKKNIQGNVTTHKLILQQLHDGEYYSR